VLVTVTAATLAVSTESLVYSSGRYKTAVARKALGFLRICIWCGLICTRQTASTVCVHSLGCSAPPPVLARRTDALSAS